MNKAFKYIACCLVGVFTLLPMQAQNIIRPKIAGPGNLWVNSYNGVLFFEQKDFETQNSAMPMQLCFYYNSSACSIDYGYGLGFSLGFEMRYHEDVIGGVDIESGDGRIDHFAKYGDEYKAPAGVFSKLVRPTFDTYLLTTKDGTKYLFDNAHHHKVTSIEDRNGNITTFKYQDTLLVEIKDAVGHTITLDYTDGLLVKASSTFSSGNFKYEYDGLRRLRKRIDPLGNVTLYGYSRQNRLNEITDANGYKTLIAYNNTGMVSRLKTDVSDKSIRYDGDKTVFIDYTEPKNIYSYYRWDEKGRATERVGLCCGIESRQKYDDDDNVIQSIDANGNAMSFTYDEYGNLLSAKDAKGNTERFSYEQQFNQILTYQDKMGNVYSLNHDSHGNLSSIIGPLGLNIRYTYNEKGWRTSTIDSEGNVTRINYNADGTAAETVFPDGGITSYTYDTYGRLSAVKDPMGYVTYYTYNALGKLTTKTDALGHKTTATYDKVGNIVRVMDATGHIKSYSYDALNHLVSITDALGNETQYKYDGNGNIISIINPLGIKDDFVYNDRNKIVSHSNGEGEKTEFDYDINGNLIAVMYPNGNIVTYEWDELDRLTYVSDNLGSIASYEYDANGNQTAYIDGQGRKTIFSYDARNRKVKESLPSGSFSKFEYDANSNLVRTTDGLGHITYYSYDSMNRNTAITDALNGKTQFVYDANGNRTKIIDAKGNMTSFSFDALNHKSAVIFANGRSLQYTYDELGRVIASKDCAEHEFKYNYDDAGNLILKTYPDGATDKYSYDQMNRMVMAINKEASLYLTYDNVGRLTSETLNGKKTSYDYDVSTGRRRLTYPSGLQITELLNSRNLISEILQNGEEIFTITYNNADQKTSQSYANGIQTSFEYDENGWLSIIRDNHGLINTEMSYDNGGNITQIKNVQNPEYTEYYGYDDINQLVSFKRGSIMTNTYEYDLLGNRTCMNENGVKTTYVSNSINAYTSIQGPNGFIPNYDGNGNLINDDTHSYAFDFNNKLCSVDGSDIYKYDALGRRIAKGNLLYYYADGQICETYQNDQLSYTYIYGMEIDEVVKMITADKSYYYHLNHLKSPIKISGDDASIVEIMFYDPFGGVSIYDASQNQIVSSQIGNNVLFSGREYDAESGNYYYRSRNQSPTLGRFLQMDSLLFMDGFNNYTYVHNNPINIVDPFGTFGCDWAKDYAKAGWQKGSIAGFLIGAAAGSPSPPSMLVGAAIGTVAIGGIAAAVGYTIGTFRDIKCEIDRRRY